MKKKMYSQFPRRMSDLSPSVLAAGLRSLSLSSPPPGTRVPAPVSSSGRQRAAGRTDQQRAALDSTEDLLDSTDLLDNTAYLDEVIARCQTGRVEASRSLPAVQVMSAQYRRAQSERRLYQRGDRRVGRPVNSWT